MKRGICNTTFGPMEKSECLKMEAHAAGQGKLPMDRI